MSTHDRAFVSLLAQLRDRADFRESACAIVRRLRARGLRRLLERERDDLLQMAKAALAAVIAWAIAGRVVGAPIPVLAPLAAVITLQVTVYRTVAGGAQQVGGVVLGVLAAIAVSSFFGLNLATLAAGVFLSLVVGRLLHLGGQSNQIAITALLVLALGEQYGLARVYDTLIGAAVGIVVNALVAPPSYTRSAARELAGLAEDMADLADEMAQDLRQAWRGDGAQDRLQRSRQLAGRLQSVREVTEQAEESLRLRPRRATSLPLVRRYTAAAVCLDHVASQLRGLARGVADVSAGVRGSGGPRDDPAPERFIAVLDDAARALGLFGRLQVSRAQTEDDLAALAAVARDAEAHLAAAFDAAGRDVPPGFRRVYDALLDDAQRMLYEVDPVRGPHRDAVPGRAAGGQQGEVREQVGAGSR